MIYQWLANGTPITDGGNVYGSTTPSLTISNVSISNAAVYSVIVSNAFGSVVSSNAALTIAGPPVIFGQPTNATVAAGATASLTVQAAGSALSFQWLKNTNPITGATGSTLTLSNVSDSDAGIYSVVVSNVYASVLSSNATLTVDDCFSPPSGLVGWWPANGNANDIVGTNNGALEGGATANAPGLSEPPSILMGPMALCRFPMRLNSIPAI